MAAISVDRVIRNLDSYSESELTKLHRALDNRLGMTSNQINVDDFEALQVGTSGTINKIREQRDRYKNQLEFYNEYFPKEWIAYINGKNVNQGQTQVGIALMIHEGGEESKVMLMEGLSPSRLQETQDNITTALYNAIGMVPEAADMGGQHLDGVTLDEWRQIFLELTPFRYTESLKSHFSQKQAQIFGRYYPQIQAAQIALNFIDESRGKTQDHFNKIIKRTFERKEERSSKTKTIVREITD
jgi:hypothetical protein